ncbi:M48 family metallopeptidase [Candidatus Falkowbacteria bacterium]|nr:M48 family metallopeptidase [Candidatus Falkowbacteria bacterium]
MYNQIDANKRKTVLLIVIFVAFIVFLGWLFGYLYNFGYAGLVVAAMISMIMSLFGYYRGDSVALWSSGAKPISATDNPYVYRMVENLCITAGLPMPKVHIIADTAINAFACGRDPAHASIAITEGAINQLENEELEGVIAHELSHIKNYDIRLMTIVIILVGIIALLTDFMLRARWYGGGRRSGNSQGGGILMLVGIILLILSPLIANLIKLAVSRKREYLADASGALLTRYPEGLARALEKIARQNQPLQRASAATAHLFIANPFSGGKKFLGNAFATHPPIEERIKLLRGMA